MCLRGSYKTSLGSSCQGSKSNGPEQNDDETVKVGRFLCKIEAGRFEVKDSSPIVGEGAGCSEDGF